MPNPTGFYTLIGYTGSESLCYHCENCGVTYADIPREGFVNYRGQKIDTVFCCGKQIKIGKPKDTVRVSDQQRGRVVMV